MREVLPVMKMELRSFFKGSHTPGCTLFKMKMKMASMTARHNICRGMLAASSSGEIAGYFVPSSGSIREQTGCAGALCCIVSISMFV